MTMFSPVAVHGGARNGAANESSHSIDEEENACCCLKAPFRSVHGHEGLYAAVAKEDDEGYYRKAHHPGVNVAVELEEGMEPVRDLGRIFQKQANCQGAYGDNQHDEHDGRVLDVLHEHNPQEGAKRQGQDGAQAEEADAKGLVLGRDDVGRYCGSGSACYAHRKACQKPVCEEERQGAHKKEERKRESVEGEPAQKEQTCASDGHEVSADKAPGKTAYDHDAGGKACSRETCPVGCLHVAGTYDKDQVVDGHDQQIDRCHDVEIACADVADNLAQAGLFRTGCGFWAQMASWHGFFLHNTGCMPCTIYPAYAL